MKYKVQIDIPTILVLYHFVYLNLLTCCFERFEPSVFLNHAYVTQQLGL